MPLPTHLHLFDDGPPDEIVFQITGGPAPQDEDLDAGEEAPAAELHEEDDPPGAVPDRPEHWQGKQVSRTTDALPGSAEKLAELERRVARREQLFDARDRQLDQGRAFKRYEEIREVLKPDGSLGKGDVLDREAGQVAVRLEPDQHDPAHTFGQRLRRLRQARRWSLECLARKSGLSRCFLSQLENGRRGNPRLVALERLATGLGVTLDQLAGRSALAV